MPATTPTPSKNRGRVLAPLVFLVLAAAVFAGVLYYVGGISGAMNLINGAIPAPTNQPAAGPTPASAVETSTAADPEAMVAAKLTYAEQIESQTNIERLARGDIASFTVDSVKLGKYESIVRVTARFVDRTHAPGEMRFARRGSDWYFVTITGLRTAETHGLADSTNSAKSIATSVTVDKKLAEAGVIEPDQGVLDTIAEQQSVNRPAVASLLDGTVKRFDLDKPILGSGTFTIPVTILDHRGGTKPAEIVVISKNVEGVERLFITTVKMD